MGSSSSHDYDSDLYYNSDMYDDENDYGDEEYDEENSDSDNNMDTEVDDTSDADEYSPVNLKVNEAIPTRVADLKEMASLNVAIALWNRVNVPKIISLEIQGTLKWNFNLHLKLRDKVVDSIENLGAPKSIKGCIASHMNVMQNEIKEWVSYHFRNVFFNHKTEVHLYNHISHMAWYSNGTINRRQTARNLMSSLRLSELEKYYLLCIYCMEDDILRLSPLLRTHNVVDELNFHDHPLIYYWNCYFRNKLNEIPVAPVSVPVDFFMVKLNDVDNWPAKEYFFERLSSDDQVRIAIWLIDKYGMKYQKLVLMKLNESQLVQVYMDRAVKIMMFYINSKSSDEVLSTWNEIRNMITKDDFVTLFNSLLKEPADDETVLETVWSTACFEFKEFFLSSADHCEHIELMLNRWVNCYEMDFFFTFMKNADENLKTAVTEKTFFVRACQKLISDDKLNLLDRLLKLCLVDSKRVAAFKRNLAEEDHFIDHYLTLNIEGDSVKLERHLQSMLPVPEDYSRFKKNLAKRTCFIEHLKTYISKCDFTTIDRLLKLCVPDPEDLIKLKENFVKDEYFMKQSERFIINDNLDMMDRMLQVFLHQPKDIVQFKNKLVTKESFIKYCEKLVIDGKEATLQTLLNSYFLNAEELAKFKRDLVVNSAAIRDKCLAFYCSGNLKNINNLLSRLLSSFPGLMTEFKKNIIMSSSGMYKSVEFFEKSPSIFNKMIAEGFLAADCIIEIKKAVIFSPFAVEKMKAMINDGRLDRIKERFSQFLTSEEDKKTLKRIVVGSDEDIKRLALNFFNKHSEQAWNSLMLWWLGTAEAVQEFKHKLPVDDIVDEMLKYCVFEVFNEKNLRLCKFKANLVFVRLDRFLTWMFEKPSKIKEYKIRRIDSFMNIETIRQLLKKKDDSYLRGVMSWFFDEDHQEINAFKSRNRGRKIAKYL